MDTIDILREISKYIPKGSWKNFIFSCKSCYLSNSDSEVDKRSNHLWTLVTMFPDKDWDWYGISKNPNITWEIVNNNRNKKWTWFALSMNPNITLDIVRENPNITWHSSGLSSNPSMTIDIIYTNIDIFCICIDI